MYLYQLASQEPADLDQYCFEIVYSEFTLVRILLEKSVEMAKLFFPETLLNII